MVYKRALISCTLLAGEPTVFERKCGVKFDQLCLGSVGSDQLRLHSERYCCCRRQSYKKPVRY